MALIKCKKCSKMYPEEGQCAPCNIARKTSTKEALKKPEAPKESDK